MIKQTQNNKFIYFTKRNYLNCKKLLNQDDKWKEKKIENEYSIKFFYHKFYITNYISIIMNSMSIFSNIIYFELSYRNIKKLEIFKQIFLYIILFLSLFMININFIKSYYYYIYIKKRKLQSKPYYKTIYFYLSLFKAFIFCWIPLDIYKDIIFEIRNNRTGLMIPYNLNQMLSLVMMIRIVINIIDLLQSSEYYSLKMHSLNRINGFKENLLYVIKCYINKKPYFILFYSILLNIVAFSFALRVLELPLSDIDTNNKFNFVNYANILWLVIATMTTVGYGDWYPRTLPGRLLAIILCLLGVFLLSLYVMILTDTITLTDNETQAIQIFKILEIKKELKFLASNFIKNFYRMRKSLLWKNIYINFYKDKFLSSLDEFKHKRKELEQQTNFNFLEELKYQLDILNFNLKQINSKQKNILDINNKIIESIR